MIKKLSVILCAVLVLSGCSSTKKSSGAMTGGMDALSADFEKNVGDRVFFGFDKSNLTAAAKDQLKKQAAWLQNHGTAKATIEGHCDERGTREYNLALGERRAEAARKFLETQGIESSRLDTISYGKERPAVIGHDEKAWSQNRRAVTTVR